MIKMPFKRLPDKDDPKVRLSVPIEMYEALTEQAKRNCRKLSEKSLLDWLLH